MTVEERAVVERWAKAHTPHPIATDIPSTLSRRAASRAASMLLGAFVFSDTSEGIDYWNAVYDRLSLLGRPV